MLKTETLKTELLGRDQKRPAATSSSIWLGTVGLDRGFGGVSHVARTTLAALGAKGSGFGVPRVVSLFDASGEGSPVPLPRGTQWTACARNRLKFLFGIAAQVVLRPDFVLYDHVDVAQCQMILPRFLRRPYGVWVHGIEVWKPLPARKLAALRNASLLLVNSRFTKQRLEEFHGPFSQAVVVPLTAGEMHDATIPTAASRPPWILTVGRVEPGRPKGHREILAALPDVVRAVPGVHWHIAGTGSAFPELQAAVRASGLDDHITVHGFVDPPALEQLFRQCRVFCMPSEGEGFGVVYLEAMKRGCIPVGSTMDAASEVIAEGGFCVDHSRPGELAAVLIRLLTRPAEESARMQEDAVLRAQQFGQESFARNLSEAIRGTWCAAV